MIDVHSIIYPLLDYFSVLYIYLFDVDLFLNRLNKTRG